MDKNDSNRPVAVIEMDDESKWAVEAWHCTNGVDCLGYTGGVYGAWLGFSCEGMRSTPFVVVMADGSTWMVCEDCAAFCEHEACEYEADQLELM